jgi:hypothetical protein
LTTGGICRSCAAINRGWIGTDVNVIEVNPPEYVVVLVNCIFVGPPHDTEDLPPGSVATNKEVRIVARGIQENLTPVRRILSNRGAVPFFHTNVVARGGC